MKKIMLFIGMFLFITNVNALTFNVDLTNIEDKGNNGTIGSITNIDIPNKTIDAYFQDIGDEVSFDLTITNSGDRAGTLRSINVTSSNDKIEYTNNLPENGLAINGNDTNTVTIKAKVLQGATNGTSSSEIKIKYTYDEGSCPEGEILSDDESMCLCPEGTERNEEGICVVPEKPIVCEDDEIYNTEKKICEKKVVPTPVNPSNPKTMDNIILITLLFMVSGLGIYAVLFKKLDTNKKKITAGVITGVATLSLSFTVLAGVFGLDNLLGAIVNPITKSKEITITVNETIDLIVTWDGDCDVTGTLTPSNVFEGGSGTESDPYQIRTANQLACFAKSVNEGETYEGKFIKQTKNIKLNDNLNDQVEAGDLSNANVWTSAGYRYYDTDASQNVTKTFNGTYDGDNHIISGMYVTYSSVPVYNDYASYTGMFGSTVDATFKNMVLSDTYIETRGCAGALVGYSTENLTLDNITTYGNASFSGGDGAGLVSNYIANTGSLKIQNSTNNMNLVCGSSCSGFVHRIENIQTSDEPNIVFKNDTNNGNITFPGNYTPSGAAGLVGYNSGRNSNIFVDNCKNTGTFTSLLRSGGDVGGLFGFSYGKKMVMTNSYNTGNFVNFDKTGPLGGLLGGIHINDIVVDNCYNSGDFTSEVYPDGYNNDGSVSNVGGIIGLAGGITITNTYNTGNITGSYAYGAGLVGNAGSSSYMENCYNTGNITGYGYDGGLVGSFGGNITKSYNTGNIHVFGGPRAGGIVGWSSGDISNTYNTGDILVTSSGGQVGGICPTSCGRISNSYNRGNITISRYGSDIGGIVGQGGSIVNSYNSGDITFLSTGGGYAPYMGGLASTGDVTNSYNLGNINVTLNGYTGPVYELAGITLFGNATNSVNNGNIFVKYNMQSFSGSPLMMMAGITFNGTAKNCFNAGTLTYDDSAMDTPVTEIPNATRNFGIGEIQFSPTSNATGNKWNTNSNGYATGCLTQSQQGDSCTAEAAALVGQYTTEEKPSILSVINGDDAYNEELDEDGLPTLKIFNE